jgi:hypothetical protein
MGFKLEQTIDWDDNTLDVELDRYNDPPNIAIRIFDGACPYTIATVNPDFLLPHGCVVIKTWDGQETLPEALIVAGILANLPVGIVKLGFCIAPVYRLLIGTPMCYSSTRLGERSGSLSFSGDRCWPHK